MIKTIFFLFAILLLYLYYYFGIVISLISIKLFTKYISIYINLVNFVIFLFGINNKINFNNIDIIKNDNKINNNLFIFNHSSIIDNMMICFIFYKNRINSNDIRTISKISSRNIQNKVMKLLDNLLVSKNLKKDIISMKKIIKKWKNKNINVILFPEGTTVQKNHKTNYKYLIKPFEGIFNSLIELHKFDNVYDVTIIYYKNNKKLVGEKDILFNLFDNDFKIHINIKPIEKDKCNLKNIWVEKDNYIDNIINE